MTSALPKSDSQPILSVQDVSKKFPLAGGFLSKEVSAVHAVQNVSFDLYRGETLGLVGESGCGKSTLGRCLIRLLEPSAGKILFQGQNILELTPVELRKLRRKFQMIFQDPFSSLNPRFTVEEIISEPLDIHGLYKSKPERKQRIFELLDICGLRRESIDRYPHEFSGGQRQRICIARALAVQPEFIVCDEPVSALDVSIQAQILNLLQDLQKEFRLTYLFISHDLKVVKHISNRIAVMYLGKIAEIGPAQELFKNPKHPYTEALLSAIPVPNPEYKKKQIILTGDVPSPISPPSGCYFHPRCPKRFKDCDIHHPQLLSSTSSSHLVACHLSNQVRTI